MENNSRKPKDLTKNRHVDILEESHLTLFQVKMKSGSDVAVDDRDDDDDMVRTSMSLNRVTATLCTQESFLRTQYI